MNINLRLTGVLGFFWSMSAIAIAGGDPVSWQLSPSSGFPSTAVGEQSVVQYTFTNKLPCAKKLVISKQTTGGNFNVINGCAQSLASNASCTVTIAFNPVKAGTSTFQMTYGYDDNRIVLPRLVAVSTGVPTSGLHGAIADLPAVLNINTSVTFNATYTNTGTTALTGCTFSNPNFFTSTGVTVSSLTSSSGTPACTSTLAAGASCQVLGQLVTSTNTGALTIQGPVTCDGGVSASPHATTVVSNPANCVSVSTVLPLPSSTYTYADNVVQFKLSNTCASAASLSGLTVSASGVTATVTQASSSPLTTCASSIAANSSCIVSASIIPQAAGSMTIELSALASGSSVSGATSAAVTTPGYTHTIHFINQCPFPVWYGVSQPGDPTVNPSPAAYLLLPQVSGVAPVTKSITISGSYGGQFFPRTGCSLTGGNFVCATGDCGSGANAQCSPSGNVTEPYTRIEETFTASSQGGYDLSLINGASIPVEFKGLGPATSQSSSPDAPFVCSAAGAPIQVAYTPFTPQYPPAPPPQGPSSAPTVPLGSCPWTYTAPSTTYSELFNFVTFTTSVQNCSSCTGSQVCGLAFDPTSPAGTIVLSCGNLIGYWTINQLCSGNVTYNGVDPSLNPSTVFHCNDLLTSYSSQNYPAGTSVYDLYSCAPQGLTLGSCYNSNTGTSTCCGAVDWNTTSPYLTWESQQAYSSNPLWLNGNDGGLSTLVPTPQASIAWLKDACPTAYSYPFDDHSSTFNCNTSDAAQQNPVNMDFDVVFCPGGLTSGLSTNP